MSISRFFKLGITPLGCRRISSETTKATRWVALDWLRYAASGLAHTPPSEG